MYEYRWLILCGPNEGTTDVGDFGVLLTEQLCSHEDSLRWSIRVVKNSTQALAENL